MLGSACLPLDPVSLPATHTSNAPGVCTPLHDFLTSLVGDELLRAALHLYKCRSPTQQGMLSVHLVGMGCRGYYHTYKTALQNGFIAVSGASKHAVHAINYHKFSTRTAVAGESSLVVLELLMQQEPLC